MLFVSKNDSLSLTCATSRALELQIQVSDTPKKETIMIHNEAESIIESSKADLSLGDSEMNRDAEEAI